MAQNGAPQGEQDGARSNRKGSQYWEPFHNERGKERRHASLALHRFGAPDPMARLGDELGQALDR